MQTEQDAIIREQKELVAEWRGKAEEIHAERESLRALVEELRSEHAAREGQLLAEYQERARELTEKARTAAEEGTRLAAERDRLERALEDERRAGNEREARLKADFDARAEQLRAEQKELSERLEGERGELAGRQEEAIREAQARVEEMQARLSEASESRAAATARAESLEADVEEARAEAGAAVEKARKAERIIHKLDTRLQNTRTTIESYDRELQRVIAERDQLRADLAEAREKAGGSDAVSQMRQEMDEMRSFLMRMEEKSGSVNEETLNTLVSQITERDSASSQALEARFSESLDASLDKITKTMEAATARPIDVKVEATDVLIDSLFDLDDQVLSSNMDELDVDTRTASSGGIGGHLEALRALRAGQPAPQEEDDDSQAEADALVGDLLEEADGDPDPAGADSAPTSAEGEHHGTEAEAAAVSGPAKDKLSASMERLRAVRESKENTE